MHVLLQALRLWWWWRRVLRLTEQNLLLVQGAEALWRRTEQLWAERAAAVTKANGLQSQQLRASSALVPPARMHHLQ